MIKFILSNVYTALCSLMYTSLFFISLHFNQQHITHIMKPTETKGTLRHSKLGN